MCVTIKDYPYYKAYKNGTIFSIKSNKVLKPRIDKNGYHKVILYNEKGPKEFRLHRLIAECFIENPNNLPLVNHKDENKQNNDVNNLEWCTVLYNNNYGNRNEKIAKAKLDKHGKEVLQIYNIDDYKITIVYPSLRSASRRTKYSRSSIKNAIEQNLIFKNCYWKFK